MLRLVYVVSLQRTERAFLRPELEALVLIGIQSSSVSIVGEQDPSGPLPSRHPPQGLEVNHSPVALVIVIGLSQGHLGGCARPQTTTQVRLTGETQTIFLAPVGRAQ